MPVKEPPRRVQFGLQDRLKLKLDLMEKHKVMQKVNKPTDWVHNLVIAEKKDGSLRLCLDPRELNKAIKRENFQIPTVENVTCRSRWSTWRMHSVKFLCLKRVPLSLPSTHRLEDIFQANALWTLLSVRSPTEESVPNIWWHWWYARDCRRHNQCVQQRRRSWSHTHQVVQVSPGETREVQHRDIAAQEIGSELHGQHNRFQRSEAIPTWSNRQYARTRVQERHSTSDRNAELFVTSYQICLL